VALRAAVDPQLFAAAVRQALAQLDALTLQAGTVTALAREWARGGWTVTLQDGMIVSAAAVVLAFGTTIRQQISIGRDHDTRGAVDAALAARVAELARLERYHIAHAPLLDRATIDVSAAEMLLPSTVPLAFTHSGAMQLAPARHLRAPIYRTALPGGWRDQLPSYRLATTSATNAVAASAWSVVTRGLTSRGPDGCDPLEWIVTGAPAVLQPLILEAASWSTGAVYLRGAYTALGIDDQAELIATLPGLEQAKLLRAGRLVEYDGLAPGAIGSALEVRGQLGLYAAGAFAGANGNEEASALGVIAGINAARYAQRRAAVVVDPAQAYIGVLVDLVSRGIGAPYRIANARIADRSRIRQDSADLRLTPLAGSLGLVGTAAVAVVRQKQMAIDTALDALQRLHVVPSARVGARLAAAGLAPTRAVVTAAALLRRPHTTYAQLQQALDLLPLSSATAAVVEAEVCYAARRTDLRAPTRAPMQPADRPRPTVITAATAMSDG